LEAHGEPNKRKKPCCRGDGGDWKRMGSQIRGKNRVAEGSEVIGSAWGAK